jgi:hypothetical protein
VASAAITDRKQTCIYKNGSANRDKPARRSSHASLIVQLSTLVAILLLKKHIASSYLLHLVPTGSRRRSGRGGEKVLLIGLAGAAANCQSYGDLVQQKFV